MCIWNIQVISWHFHQAFIKQFRNIQRSDVWYTSICSNCAILPFFFIIVSFLKRLKDDLVLAYIFNKQV